jgi:hypothetical protein
MYVQFMCETDPMMGYEEADLVKLDTVPAPGDTIINFPFGNNGTWEWDVLARTFNFDCGNDDIGILAMVYCKPEGVGKRRKLTYGEKLLARFVELMAEMSDENHPTFNRMPSELRDLWNDAADTISSLTGNPH